MICGYLIAAALLPDVAASLEGLYGAQVAGRLTLDAKWWIPGLGMAALGALAAAAGGLFKTFHLPVLSVAQPFGGARRNRDICGVRPFSPVRDLRLLSLRFFTAKAYMPGLS